jgi:hypothetical protein
LLSSGGRTLYLPEFSSHFTTSPVRANWVDNPVTPAGCMNVALAPRTVNPPELFIREFKRDIFRSENSA